MFQVYIPENSQLEISIIFYWEIVEIIYFEMGLKWSDVSSYIIIEAAL